MHALTHGSALLEMLRTAHDMGSMHRAVQVLAPNVHKLTRALIIILFGLPLCFPLRSSHAGFDAEHKM